MTSDKKYAVIRIGSRQYKVSEGDKLIIDRQHHQPGDEIEFNDVLVYADDKEVTIGQPTLKDIKVKATVEGETRGKKLRTTKFRRRKGYRRKIGHKQPYTVVKITGIAKS